MGVGTKDFVFPTTGKLPHRDDMAGLALGKGGIRGVYHAGVVHAFVMCGYYPKVVAGTSSGALCGSILAFASEMDDQEQRLALVSAFIDTWAQNPAAAIFSRLTDPERGLGRLTRDLLDIDLPLGKLIPLLSRAMAGHIPAIVRLASALPIHRLPMLLGLLRGSQGALEGLLRKDGAALRALQQIISAYGMPRALLEEGIVESHFAGLIERFAPRGLGTRFSDLKRTRLLFQVANLSRKDPQGSGRRLETLGAPTDGGAGGSSGAKIFHALRAACALAPLFPGVRMNEVTETPPDGTSLSDLLMDAGVVEKDPLSPIIDHWSRFTHEGRRRLFAVYLAPMGEVSMPPELARSSFFGPALHSLLLWDRLDQQYSSKVMSMISEMVEAIENAELPVPRQVNGSRYVAVDTTGIAPRQALRFLPLSVPRDDELLSACATGCRSTLEALHAATIKSLSNDRPVPCERVLGKVREGQEDKDAASQYFQPLPKVCAHCPKELEPPRRTVAKMDPDDRAAANDFKPFHQSSRDREPSGKPERLTVVVPAGGVFLGVFQFGAIAALKAYGIQPDLYAGASVGTLFSYLLQAFLNGENDGALKALVDLAMTVPHWVDKIDTGEGSAPPRKSVMGPLFGALLKRRLSPPRGAVDITLQTLSERWRSSEARGLRALRPREIVEVLAAPKIEPHSAAEERWRSLHQGLRALLFTAAPSRRTGKARPLGTAYDLAYEEKTRRALHDLFQNLCRLQLIEAISFLDTIAANLDFFDPFDAAHEGEIIGFSNVAAELTRIVFSTAGPTLPTLKQHSEKEKVRFVFTVTNHTRGIPEHFGFADEHTSSCASPDALQACLAASSFPLAFRRRKHSELFPAELGKDPDVRYADGGIFNNFPSDSAFAYLHALSGGKKEDNQWLGSAPHRVILLSLTSPMVLPKMPPEGDLALFAFYRAYAVSEDEKVDKTLRWQKHINALAGTANPLLAARGARQGIVAEMEVVSPAYTIYPHAFAFKKILGFEREKQLEMMASGCRRTRLALEWSEFQSDPKKAQGRRPEVLLPIFRDKVRHEVRRVTGIGSPEGREACVFGTFKPASAGTNCCPFTGSEATIAVFERCKKTIDAELSVPDLKLYPRLLPRE